MAFKDDEKRRAYFREYNKGWYQRHKEPLKQRSANVTSYAEIVMQYFIGMRYMALKIREMCCCP